MTSLHHPHVMSLELHETPADVVLGLQSMVRLGSPVGFQRGAPPARETGVSEVWGRWLVIEASFEVVAAG
jgi:hypothetical protein